jgi:hypothetical protein
MQEQAQLNITLDKTTGVECDECKSTIFSEGLMLRKVSKFLSGTEKDGLIPIPVFYCINCKHINEDMLPPELR